MSATYNVLVLCTGNSARSVIAEAVFNTMGGERFRAYSAGSNPTGSVNPYALEICRNIGYPTETLSSKRWDVFATADAPVMDFVITVCDNAQGEQCPVWPGTPKTLHWGYADPAAVQGTDAERRAAFEETYRQIVTRVSLFMNLPLEELDELSIRAATEFPRGSNA